MLQQVLWHNLDDVSAKFNAAHTEARNAIGFNHAMQNYIKIQALEKDRANEAMAVIGRLRQKRVALPRYMLNALTEMRDADGADAAAAAEEDV